MIRGWLVQTHKQGAQNSCRRESRHVLDCRRCEFHLCVLLQVGECRDGTLQPSGAVGRDLPCSHNPGVSDQGSAHNTVVTHNSIFFAAKLAARSCTFRPIPAWYSSTSSFGSSPGTSILKDATSLPSDQSRFTCGGYHPRSLACRRQRGLWYAWDGTGPRRGAPPSTLSYGDGGFGARLLAASHPDFRGSLVDPRWRTEPEGSRPPAGASGYHNGQEQAQRLVLPGPAYVDFPGSRCGSSRKDQEERRGPP